MSDEPEPQRPMLRVVRGEPTAEELAALVAVLAAKAGGGTPEPSRPVSAWTDRSLLVRRPVAHGPGAWRASAFPS